VAVVGEAVGARSLAARGYGERAPRVPHDSASNMAQNRRVEIICLR
ncbi:MAG: OmpA family protein, partial [Pseudomonadota bacterium]|nr:OmpA family protein [Pseudomonadota bacterium]